MKKSPKKPPTVRLHVDKNLKGLQFIAGKSIFGLLKRRFKACRGKMFVSEDGGLFIYFNTNQIPWIGMLDPAIRKGKIMVSPLAMAANEIWKAASTSNQ